jgi:hypothetical protein
MTFKEQREAERLADGADLGPGSNTGHIKEFGAGVKGNIDMGKKYVTKYNNNPPPGLYNTEAADALTKPKIRSALILEYDKTEKKA